MEEDEDAMVSAGWMLTGYEMFRRWWEVARIAEGVVVVAGGAGGG